SAEGIANIIDTDIDGNANISRDEKIEKYKNKIMKPDFAASRGYIDDVIEPSKTRQKLISYFDAIDTKVVNRLNKKHGNMPI
ncbi:MAG: methylmalonyl-CoA carboxyltransferase, partial [Lachnospiraceae bacterium]|nr:methylmalonyl-CoA carboxyltransferase [Lachnospiraceae bacterium]